MDPAFTFGGDAFEYVQCAAATKGDREGVLLCTSTTRSNALVGGLEFDVEDKQAAIELMLTRQLD